METCRWFGPPIVSCGYVIRSSYSSSVDAAVLSMRLFTDYIPGACNPYLHLITCLLAKLRDLPTLYRIWDERPRITGMSSAPIFRLCHFLFFPSLLLLLRCSAVLGFLPPLGDQALVSRVDENDSSMVPSRLPWPTLEPRASSNFAAFNPDLVHMICHFCSSSPCWRSLVSARQVGGTGTHAGVAAPLPNNLLAGATGPESTAACYLRG